VLLLVLIVRAHTTIASTAGAAVGGTAATGATATAGTATAAAGTVAGSDASKGFTWSEEVYPFCNWQGDYTDELEHALATSAESYNQLTTVDGVASKMTR
jgi:hypothetical protein